MRKIGLLETLHEIKQIAIIIQPWASFKRKPIVPVLFIRIPKYNIYDLFFSELSGQMPLRNPAENAQLTRTN